MINLQKKFILVSIGLVIVITFAFTIWSANLSKQASVAKIEGIINYSAQASMPGAQTYQADKTPSIQAGDWIQGNKNNNLKIFVYEDYAGMYSADLATTLKRLALDYPEATLIFRPFISKSDPLSALGAQAMVCAGDNWPAMREGTFNLVRDNKLSLAGLTEAAGQAGISADDFTACMSGLPSLEKSAKLSATASDYSVLGAPTMFINNNLIVGARPYEEYTDSSGDKVDGLKTIIERLRK